MTEQVQQVTTKDPKKIKSGKRLAEHNHRKREQMKAQKSESETNLTFYGAGAIVATEALGIIGYYIYQSKNPVNQPKETPVQQPTLHWLIPGLAQAPKETPDKFNMD